MKFCDFRFEFKFEKTELEILIFTLKSAKGTKPKYVMVKMDKIGWNSVWHFGMLARFKSSWVSMLKQSKHA
jgi:hypothetical protein